uniref:Uncharacterized protein n=1 Tax=Geladintestivirus 1 TaxID=3233133 RepID=A0AAU8MGB4_9CAUD
MKDKLSLLKQIQQELKYGIIISDLLMTLYVLWLIITDNSTWLIGILLGFTPYGTYMLFRADKLYDLCICHKLMIAHIVIVYSCCLFQAKCGFGEYLPIARWLAFISGILLIFLIIINKIYGCEKLTK